MHEPGRQPGDDDPPVLEDAAAEAERGDRAEAVVHVRLRRAAAQRGDDVARQEFALPVRVLRVGHRPGARHGRGRHRGGVAGRPRVRHRRRLRPGPQVRPHDDQPALVPRQVGAPAGDRVRAVARGPHDQLRVELLAAGQHDVPTDRRGDLGIQVHARAALLEVGL
ncbi:hypothetical protein L2C96_17335 [Amycolatopsis tucumanensis]|nr:hypothetical protein [Amycolatopsis tucumanensis]MCF6424028.1 hypothetical protein [Amycolatopsis tucumanensis]